MHLPRSIAPLTLVLAACASAHETPDAPDGSMRGSLDDWQSEFIPLPPEFAPTLPAGEELLLFAPGMFDPEAEDYWSYVFLMRLETGPLDASAMSNLLFAYYDGLIRAVLEGDGHEAEGSQARVAVAGDARDYLATIHTTDAFVTREPLKLHVRIRTESATATETVLRVMASPQAPGHAIWDALEYAAGTLTFESP